MTVPRAPSDLLKSGRALWRETVQAWELTPAEQRVLVEACRTADELDMIRAAIRESPPTVEGSKGQPRPSPLWEEARRHREQLARLFAALKLPAEVAEVAAGGSSVTSIRASRAANARWDAQRRSEAEAQARRKRG